MIWKLFTFHPSAYIMLIVTEGIMCETDTRIQISSNLTPQFRLYVFVCVRDSMCLCEWVYAREGVRACVRARARACVCVCVYVCVCMWESLFAGWLVFWAESTTKDNSTAINNVQSVSYSLCTQVIKPKVIQKPQNQSWHKFTWKTYTNIKLNIFEELLPSVSLLLKKSTKG